MNRMKVALITLLVAATVAFAQQTNTPPVKADLRGLIAGLPSATAPVLNESQALLLTTFALACLDNPQAAPGGRGYLWEATYRPPDDYQKNLAFYGCFDWHSSVNSTWML